jgi:hypothetical protein
MKRQLFKYILMGTLLFGGLSTAVAGPVTSPNNSTITGGGDDSPACDFRSAMRKLWEDHITWTRLFIISALDELPNLDATTKRLLKNQQDIGNAIKPFYGNAAGNQLTALLREHILIAAEIVTALKNDDNDAAQDAIRRWYANADEIAAFLNAANEKNWPLDEMKDMMREHLDLTTEEVVAHLEERWEDDVKAYDKIHVQILEMADMLAFGIINQFPEEF